MYSSKIPTLNVQKAEFAPFRWERSIELIGPVPAEVRADSDQSGRAILFGHWSTTESAAFKTRILVSATLCIYQAKCSDLRDLMLDRCHHPYGHFC